MVQTAFSVLLNGSKTTRLHVTALRYTSTVLSGVTLNTDHRFYTLGLAEIVSILKYSHT